MDIIFIVNRQFNFFICCTMVVIAVVQQKFLFIKLQFRENGKRHFDYKEKLCDKKSLKY